MTVAATASWLFQRWPTWLSAAGAIAAGAGWVASYRLARRLARAGQPAGGQPAGALAGTLRSPQGALRAAGLIAVRVALGFAAIWLTFQVLARVFVLTTPWAIWPLALLAAGAAEALVWLYALERRIVSRRMGMLLTGLRLLLLGLAALMLVQPVLVSMWTETKKRPLAVLVDVSASMRISDRQLPAHERLRLAEAFSGPAVRTYRLEDAAAAVRRQRGRIVPEQAWLDRLAQGRKDTAGVQLAQRRKELHETFSGAAEALAAQAETIQAVLKDFPRLEERLQAELRDAKAVLAAQVRTRLLDAAGWTHPERSASLAENLDRLRDSVRRAVEPLDAAAGVLERAGDELDRVLYEQLTPPDRAAVDAVAALTRLDLAKAALLHRGSPPGSNGPQESLLERLKKQYDVRVYTFAGGVAQADPTGWTDPIPQALAGTPPATAAPVTTATAPADSPDGSARKDADESIQHTDLAGAIRKVLAEIAQAELAGVLLLTDGQAQGSPAAGAGQGAAGPEGLARQLGGRGSALCAIALGGEKPPADAGIIAIETAETVYLSDRMFVTAELKLDGLAGKDVPVALYDGDRRVDSKTIRAVGDVFRTRIQLTDQPDKPGLHAYRVEIAPSPDEVFSDNNSYPLTLSVTEDQTKVLLVDSRPRWEFRYLKNLFSGRDKTVRLQYVLTQPDVFIGQPARAKVHASVQRPAGEEEATLLPASEQEWLKFDVIILGDVAAGELTAEDMRAIRRFVSDRAGTLILIAGPRAMPADFAGTPLAEMIPVRLPPPAATRPAGQPDAGRAPVDGFRIALTAEGADHVILRQDVDAEKSTRVWEAVPALFWRSRFTEATPAATVLAYALDGDAPKHLREAAGTASLPENLAAKREEYQRQHALIATAPHGLGKVMLLTSDQTWRLRYRVGDTYHHKFWGQVLRWATAGKLPAGTPLVKLGTDRTRYAPHARPTVRAKIVREDFSPVVTEQVAVKVFSGPKLIGRAPMKYVPDSPGLYSATLEELPAGTYRLELDAPAAEGLLRRDGADKVATEISVDPSCPAEQVELAVNRDLLARLASLSHNGAVLPPYQALRVLEFLPAGQVTEKHRKDFPLWDSWLLLGMFCSAATAEWLLRKRVGLT